MFIAWKNLNLLPVRFNNILIALMPENDNKTDVFLLSWLGSFNFISFFRSHSVLIQPTHYRCRGLLLHLITLSDTHSTGLSGRGTGPSQRPLYLPTHNIHKRETSIPPAGFERAILPIYIYICIYIYIYTLTHTYIQYIKFQMLSNVPSCTVWRNSREP